MRCRACNRKLDDADLSRKARDWDYCSECRSASKKEYNADEKQYDHADLTGVPMDGTTLSIEDYEKSQEYYGQN